MLLLRPFGRFLKAINIKLYILVRWKLRRLMKNPMSQQFLVPLLVKSGTAVIDVGANLGQLTIPIARLVGSKGIVHAFEPITQNHLKLEKT